MSESVVITGAARTPMGGFQGDCTALAAHDSGAFEAEMAFRRFVA